MFDISHFYKTYGDTLVLDDCSGFFDGRKIIFIAGGKKSGKTTLLRCIAGLEEHSGHMVCLPGSRICYYEEFLAAPENLSGRQYLEMILDKERYKKNEKRDKLAEVTGLIGLSEAAMQVPIRAYSLQEKKRLQIGQALAQRGNILLFDGLMDVFDESEFREIGILLEEMRKSAVVVITTRDRDIAGLMKGSLLLLSDGKLTKGGERIL